MLQIYTIIFNEILLVKSVEWKSEAFMIVFTENQ